MDSIKLILMMAAFIGFGFFSIQKGRAYERGLISIEKENKRSKKGRL